MGEVYRARDPRLDRDVAIKILPDAFAADPDRVARFQREAKTLAALNHPNIGGILGIEDAGGVTALVMELVEGEDLAERIRRGAIPIGEALPIARQIADALQAAHDNGIIHRDLKPANIKLRPDGTVKVLDFGLAKAMEPAGGRANPTESPTITTPAMTRAGIILGTAAYMSPEQARGNPLDARSDIWSFGCVLYEMLIGRRAFAGDEVTDVLASILAREPDLAALPAGTPPPIRRLLRRCLEKDRTGRLHDIADARLEIADAMGRVDPDVTAIAPARPGRRTGERLAWIGALTVLALALAASWTQAFRPSVAAAEMRLDIATPPTTAPQSLALSPDGRTIAFVATADERAKLWLRSLETGASRPIAGTEGAVYPFWSPDSRAVGFFADGRLRRVDVDGGSVQTIAIASSGEGGTWNRDNVILFASLGSPISRVAATGGAPAALSGLTLRGSDFSPEFLPDGRHFLYFVRGNPEIRGIYAGALDGTLEPRRLVDTDSGGVYAASGHLMFVRQGTLYAQALDPEALTLSGRPVQVAEHVSNEPGREAVSVSRTGSVAYRTGSADAQQQFVWFDRSGKETSKLGEPVSTSLSDPSLSPDGQRVVLYRNEDGNTDVWLFDIKRGVLSRFTTDPADDVVPVWSPDGGRVVFSSNRTGVHDLYVKPATGGGTEAVLLSSAEPKLATDWSADGHFLLFNRRDPKRGVDIWALPMDGTGKPFPLVQTPFDEQSAQFSPDAHWIAYQSNESGRTEIYVLPFPGPGNSRQVSSDGGTQVRWGRDGKELFYLTLNGRLMTVPFRSALSGQPPELGQAVALFTPPIGNAVQQGDWRYHYMVSSDSQRFLVDKATEEPNSPITLILNWKPRQ